MKKNIAFLAAMKNAKTPAAKKKIISKCGSSEICTLAEISKNVLKNKIKLSPRMKRRICVYKRAVRDLASKKINYKTKKRKLLKGGWLLPASLLISAAAPIISQLFSKKD
jgi:hypothetical protein